MDDGARDKSNDGFTEDYVDHLERLLTVTQVKRDQYRSERDEALDEVDRLRRAEAARDRYLLDLEVALDLLEELAEAYPQAASGHHPAMGAVQDAHRLLARSWARRVCE